MKMKQLIYTIALLLICGITYAQYSIKKHSINNGGGKMSGGTYELNGSIGQTDASTALSNGNYTITGGFWQQNTDLIYKNGFE